MAHPAPERAGEDPTPQAYAALEKLYSEGRWREVEVTSQNLLKSLPSGGDWGARVVLLLGHTRLYGFADPEGAEANYKQVLGWCEADEESSNSSKAIQGNPEALAILKSIAAAGLAQCQAQPASQESQEPQPSPHATPWLPEEAPQPEPTAAMGDHSPSSPFVRPVPIQETSETPARPLNADAPNQPTDESQLTEELAQGLLRVLVRAN